MVGLIASVLLIAPGAKLMPHDEAAQNPSFLEFRNSLKAALAKNDRAFVEAHISKSVRYSFGDDRPGRAGLLNSWAKSPTGVEGFYKELATILNLGGGFQKGGTTTFWAPY